MFALPLKYLITAPILYHQIVFASLVFVIFSLYSLSFPSLDSLHLSRALLNQDIANHSLQRLSFPSVVSVAELLQNDMIKRDSWYDARLCIEIMT